MANPKPRGQRHALMIMRVADALMDELIGYRSGKLMPVLRGNQIQHQVERSRAARAGEPVAVDLEQFGGDLDLWELLAKRGEALPMNGAAIAIEQPGSRECMASRGDRADIGALPI